MIPNLFLKKGLVDEIEKEEIFTGLPVMLKDHTEMWLDEDLIKIDKPELVKEAERYLRERVQGRIEEDKSSHSTIQRTTLNKWTGGD